MDAAIDAMSLMGFPEKLVRSTVNRLIKTVPFLPPPPIFFIVLLVPLFLSAQNFVHFFFQVYGPEGWVFIEEGGYSELIELLLAEQKPTDASAQVGTLCLVTSTS